MEATTRLHRELAAALRARRRADGGFALGDDGVAEVEPTAVAALALDDPTARAWLAGRQGPDGGFRGSVGAPEAPNVAAVAALALSDAEAARHAVAHAVAARSLPLPNAPDPNRREGWGWTEDARSLVEPTARVLTAVKTLTPDDRPTRTEALTLLVERRVADGGWSFGNPSVFGVDLLGCAQTTAIALVALQREDEAIVDPALRFLRRAWPEDPGGLTLAQALLAFRLHGRAVEVPPVADALGELWRRRAFVGRTLALAWATLATGPDDILDPLRARP